MTRRRHLNRLLALVMIVCATLSCSGSGPAKRVEIGMTVHSRGDDPAGIARQFDLMAAMHVNWVRLDIPWAWVEPERGSFDWSYPDAVVDQAAAHGMHVLAVLASTPPWARSSAPGHAGISPYARPRHLSDFADFVRVVAQRYTPRGVCSWEIWNEPNIRLFWPPRPDADEYGELFRAAAAAIRDVDSKATILTGGLSPRYDLSPTEIAPVDYVEALYANGAARLADGIAAHPYSFPALPMSVSQRNIIGGFTDLPDLHAAMSKHGDRTKKIWMTEYGMPTGTSVNAVSEKLQEDAFLQAREQLQHWDWSGPLIYYELVDGGTDPAQEGLNFGVLRADLMPKRVATALMKTPPG
jgi:polysaccharide biosynthesis protein PslG